MEHQTLRKTLKPIHLWSIAVGMVISGQYFGWNYGFSEGGVVGMMIASLLVTAFFACFIFSYAELSTSIPNAGGPSAYAARALGPFGGYVAGIACLLEFVFAPPAIAVSTGAYVHFLIPSASPVWVTTGIFILFILINMVGMKGAALIELIATVIALVGLALFYTAGLPHVSLDRLVPADAPPLAAGGVLAAVPFAIWFFLAIEGGAMAAEEVENPKRDIPRGFISGILTLATATVLTLLVTAGLGGGEGKPADYPLPQALSGVYGEGHWVVVAVTMIGLIGLIASLHGIIIGYSRQTYALSRAGYFPKFLSRLNRHGVPVWGLLLPGAIGVVCAGSAAFASALIELAVFGAVLMYCLSMISLFVLRYKEPGLERPFRVAFPVVPAIALALGLLFLYCVVRYSMLVKTMPVLGVDIPLWAVIVAIYAAAVLYYAMKGRHSVAADRTIVAERP
ncbi:ethanolamine permease [Paenibacillus ginsengihumi]|uniref:ethanolamine permease n=1 Tax=Paenibacillus ginsengihumi TaxID=431596 RepID=UPI00036C41B0|nr:ethanolamine permease [Paenibacillus ginsengihumi]